MSADAPLSPEQIAHAAQMLSDGLLKAAEALSHGSAQPTPSPSFPRRYSAEDDEARQEANEDFRQEAWCDDRADLWDLEHFAES